MRHANSSGPLEDFALDCLLAMLVICRMIQVSVIIAAPIALARWCF